MKRAAGNYGGITTVAVKKATGRTWAQWLALLDQAGARKLPHREIAQLLDQRPRQPRLPSPDAALPGAQARQRQARVPEHVADRKSVV